MCVSTGESNQEELISSSANLALCVLSCHKPLRRPNMCLCICKHHSYWDSQFGSCAGPKTLVALQCMESYCASGRFCAYVCFPVTSKNMEGGGFVFVNINQISWESIMKELKIISTVHPSIIDTSFMF